MRSVDHNAEHWTAARRQARQIPINRKGTHQALFEVV
jgi:hypothetical protein